MKLEIAQSIDSTNLELIRRVCRGEDVPHELVLCANEQTGGIGRVGRAFSSPKGGIYMSLHLKANAASTLAYMPAAALVVSKTISELLAIKTQIKWVNDVLLAQGSNKGKKVCGILAQCPAPGHVILGVGINYAQPAFSGELAQKAAVLFPPESNQCPPMEIEQFRTKLAAALTNVPTLASSDWVSEYSSLSSVINTQVRLVQANTTELGTGSTIDSGKCIGFTPTGGIIISHADGSSATYQSGEISLA